MRALKLVGILLLCAASATAQEAPKEKLNATLENLAKSKEQQAALREKLAATQKELADLQNHSAALAERLQVSERRVSGEEKSLAAANTRLAAKQKEFEARKAEYVRSLSILLRMRDVPVTALFAQPDQMQELMRTATLLEKTNSAAATKARALEKDLRELKTLKTDAAERRSRTLDETAALNAEQSQLEKALRVRQKLQAALAEDNARAEQKVASLSRESQSLQSLIGKLEAEAKAEAARAKKEKKPEKKQVATKEFQGSKGSLRAPVSGELIHRYGERKSSNETYRGLVYRARPGATVVAPYDGEIVYTGPFRDYGTILLIKHRNGYISLISGLGNVTARLGQTVIRGEPVATMPASGSPEAYVELRGKDAKPIDPGDWFANVSQELSRR